MVEVKHPYRFGTRETWIQHMAAHCNITNRTKHSTFHPFCCMSEFWPTRCGGSGGSKGHNAGPTFGRLGFGMPFEPLCVV
jgi:hypothetical protein